MSGHWRPIAVAPENEDVLVFCPGADTPIMICHLLSDDDEEAWYEQNPSIGAPLDVEPTHFMLLPEPPDEGGSA